MPNSFDTSRHQLSPTRRFHSVHDRSVADTIMKKVGVFDDGYCTQERQIQAREREIHRQLEVLKYSPDTQFEATAFRRATEAAIPPRKKLDLTDVDPSPINIHKKAQRAEASSKDRRHAMLTSKEHASFRDSSGVSALETLEDQLRQTFTNLDGSERGGTYSSFRNNNHSTTYSNNNNNNSSFSPASSFRIAPSASLLQRSASGSSLPRPGSTSNLKNNSVNVSSRERDIASAAEAMKRAALPKLSQGREKYSSTLMQLRRTKHDVDEVNANISAVRSILQMQGSTDMKRTITRMFADPLKAAQISDEEYTRREKLYDEERQRNLDHQASLLKADREAFEKEVASWRTK
eukprot:PhM_4_TR419/c0_g1_i1/m.23582